MMRGEGFEKEKKEREGKEREGGMGVVFLHDDWQHGGTCGD